MIRNPTLSNNNKHSLKINIQITHMIQIQAIIMMQQLVFIMMQILGTTTMAQPEDFFIGMLKNSNILL